MITKVYLGSLKNRDFASWSRKDNGQRNGKSRTWQPKLGRRGRTGMKGGRGVNNRRTLHDGIIGPAVRCRQRNSPAQSHNGISRCNRCCVTLVNRPLARVMQLECNSSAARVQRPASISPASDDRAFRSLRQRRVRPSVRPDGGSDDAARNPLISRAMDVAGRGGGGGG